METVWIVQYDEAGHPLHSVHASEKSVMKWAENNGLTRKEDKLDPTAFMGFDLFNCEGEKAFVIHKRTLQNFT